MRSGEWPRRSRVAECVQGVLPPLLCFHRKLAHITLPLDIYSGNELSCVLLFENLDWICFEPSEHEDCFRWMRRLAAMRRAGRTLERMLIDGTNSAAVACDWSM